MKEEILKIINELIKEYEPDAIPQSYDDYSEGAEALRKLRDKVSQMQLPVKPACEFTDKQLEIISLAVEKWLLEDTFINYNGKHGAHFIDKKNGNPTLRDRLLEMSKSV